MPCFDKTVLETLRGAIWLFYFFNSCKQQWKQILIWKLRRLISFLLLGTKFQAADTIIHIFLFFQRGNMTIKSGGADTCEHEIKLTLMAFHTACFMTLKLHS